MKVIYWRFKIINFPLHQCKHSPSELQ